MTARQAKPFARVLPTTTVLAAGVLGAGVPAHAVPADAVPAAAQTFKNLQTARCLTNPAGTGGMVNAYACTARSDQKWNVSSIGS